MEFTFLYHSMQWSPNCDLAGNDITITIVTAGNISYCLTACKSNGNCNHVTYAPNSLAGYPSGNCWFKYKNGILASNANLFINLYCGIIY